MYYDILPKKESWLFMNVFSFPLNEEPFQRVRAPSLDSKRVSLTRPMEGLKRVFLATSGLVWFLLWLFGDVTVKIQLLRPMRSIYRRMLNICFFFVFFTPKWESSNLYSVIFTAALALRSRGLVIAWSVFVVVVVVVVWQKPPGGTKPCDRFLEDLG